MQLFVLDYNPIKSAEMLSDCHLIKMCLETAQILSSVRFNNGMNHLSVLPKPYNPKHPVILAINNSYKLNWLLDYNKALHNEYIYRFNKKHSYFELINIYETLRNKAIKNYNKENLDFARDFKDFSTDKFELIEAFRSYYRFKKSIIKRWKYTKRNEPVWLQ